MFHQEYAGYKAIHKAVAENHLEDVMHHLARRTDVNQRTDAGQTPLHIAVARGHRKILHVLLGHQPEINARDHQGRTPLHYAAIAGSEEMADDLLQVRECDIEACDNTKATPLHVAASSGQTGMVRFLINRNANVDVRNASGLTPLHEAVEHERIPTIEMLLAGGADYDEVDETRRTLLHLAARHGREDIAQRLLARGATVDVKDQSGRTPLHEAAMRGFVPVAQMLLEHGADLTIKDVLGRTPFMLASLSNQREMIAYLRQVSHTMPAAPATPQPETALQIEGASPEALMHIYEEALQAVPEYLFILDRTGRFILVNHLTARSLGLRSADFVGKTWQTLGLRAESMLPLTDLCRTVIGANTAQRRELPWPTVNGVRILDCIASPLSQGGSEVIGVLCVARDITEAKSRKSADAEQKDPRSLRV